MNHHLVLRSAGLGLLAGSAVVTIGLLRPEPSVPLLLVFALLFGATSAAAIYRRGRGQIPLPDNALLVLFLSMTAFWAWVVLTGYGELVIGGWVDTIAAMIVVGIPIGGIVLVIWNRVSTGRDLFDPVAELPTGPER